MINNIIIIYIEGYDNQQPKQEKYLFQTPPSRNLWSKYLIKEMGFTNFQFAIIPKKFTNQKNKNKYYKILDDKISKFLSISKEKQNQKFLHLLITGDHDENNSNELINREKIASEINDKYSNNKNISSKILLFRDKNFNLEWIMSQIVGEKVFKKELKKRINNEHPTVDELMKYPKKEMTIKDLINNLLNSEHPLFKEIFNIKNIINKK